VRPARPRIAALAAAASLAAACGKIGPPLPPLRQVPVAVPAFTAERIGDKVTLTFIVPDANLDGSTPPRVDAVEVFAITQPAGAPAPTTAQLVVPSYRIARMEVRRPSQTPSPADSRLEQGHPAAYVDTLPQGTAGVRYYGVAGVAGNRRGPAPTILALPLSPLPLPPSGLTLDYSEKELKLHWTVGAETDRFVVEETDSAGTNSKRATPVPVAGPEFTAPMELGRERCFVVRAAEASAGVVALGSPSPPQCVTPVDRFAPAPPTSLNAFPGDGAIELLWTASASADAAGYLILRGEGPDGTLQPLTAEPIAATQYRDQSAKAGVTYSYQVVAVDGAKPPNRSEPSNRQVVTARRP
jgi:hypothetical protein